MNYGLRSGSGKQSTLTIWFRAQFCLYSCRMTSQSISHVSSKFLVRILEWCGSTLQPLWSAIRRSREGRDPPGKAQRSALLTAHHFRMRLCFLRHPDTSAHKHTLVSLLFKFLHCIALQIFYKRLFCKYIHVMTKDILSELISERE